MGKAKKKKIPEGLPETVEPAQIPRRKIRHSEMIRREAGIVFVTDPHGVSIQELVQDPRFAHIPTKTLAYWCNEDKWVERRQAVFERWRKDVEERLGSEMAKSRIAEIRELHNVRKLALQKLYSVATPVKSWEGVAKTLLEINARLEELASSVGREMLPAGGGGGLAPGEANMRSDLSVEEVRAAAREVLRLRRATIRSALPPPDAGDEPPEEPIAETEPEEDDGQGDTALD